MKNVYWIIPEVLCGRTGPEEEPWDLAELKAGGIDCIVSLSDDPVNREQVAASGIEYEAMVLPEGRIRDTLTARILRRAARAFVKFVDEHRAQGRSVLVHCLWGNDRTGLMLAAYLILREHFAPEDAIAHVRNARPDALRLPGYDATLHSLLGPTSAPPKRKRTRRSRWRSHVLGR